MTLHRALRRLGPDRRGASAVEFALVIGPFLLLVFGTFEFGRMFWTQNAIQQAAIAGARCAGIGQAECSSGGESDVTRTKAYVQAVANGWLIPLSEADVSLDTAAECSGMPGFAEVSIAYQFHTPLPAFIVALADGPTLRAASCFPNASA